MAAGWIGASTGPRFNSGEEIFGVKALIHGVGAGVERCFRDRDGIA
jgi:hypothetical protein